MADVADIRAALAALRTATSPADKAAARSRALSLGAQAALTITDKAERDVFVRSLDSDIEDAAG
jgi:hypothetical protein